MCLHRLLNKSKTFARSAPAWTKLSHEGLWGPLPSRDWWIQFTFTLVLPPHASSDWGAAGRSPQERILHLLVQVEGLEGNNAFEKKKEEADQRKYLLSAIGSHLIGDLPAD